MATLTKDSARNYMLGDIADLPVAATRIIYEGAAVGADGAGYARPLVAGDRFRGFCAQNADNTTGASGDIYAKVKREGMVQLPIAGLVIADFGKDVYASDDDTFTLSAGASNTRIGYVDTIISAGVGVVRFDAVNGVRNELSDGSTGTVSDTIAAITDVPTKNAIASLASAVNYLIRRTGN